MLSALSSEARKGKWSVSGQGISAHRLQGLVRLHRLGGGIAHEIAASLKMSPDTERKYRIALTIAGLLVGAADELPPLADLKAAIDKELPSIEPAHEQSSRARWKPQVKELLDNGLTPKAIQDRLRLKHKGEYEGELGAVKRMVKRLRLERGVSAKDIAIPVETEPAHTGRSTSAMPNTVGTPRQGASAKRGCSSWCLATAAISTSSTYSTRRRRRG